MIDHLPECPLLEPCSADIPQHGFCSRQNIICIHCERECICDRLRACEQRVRADERSWEGAVVVARAGYQDGYDAALRDASDAVEDQPDIIFRGAAWVKHEHALFAIDALQGKR